MNMKPIPKQISFPRQLVNHFYLGVIITLFYIWLSPKIVGAGYPSMYMLLIAEMAILAPLVLFHLLWSSKRQFGHFSYSKLIAFTDNLKTKTFIIWVAGGLVAVMLIYIPLYPVGQLFRETVFSWLPEWFFNPSYGTDNLKLISRTFLIAIFIDGFIGPIAEEFFFRGYLLPRMAYLKKWAPIVNGALFGLYHFWQPHNLIALMAIGIILSYVVWKKRNVYLGIVIHCAINILGAVGGYLAIMNGTMIVR